jgi:hypothetical protein
MKNYFDLFKDNILKEYKFEIKKKKISTSKHDSWQKT